MKWPAKSHCCTSWWWAFITRRDAKWNSRTRTSNLAGNIFRHLHCLTAHTTTQRIRFTSTCPAYPRPVRVSLECPAIVRSLWRYVPHPHYLSPFHCPPMTHYSPHFFLLPETQEHHLRRHQEHCTKVCDCPVFRTHLRIHRGEAVADC